MRIALIGFGKMGKEIARLAKEQGMAVAATIDPNEKEAGFKGISKEAIADADVCIDFSQPDAVVENVKKIASFGKNIVVGTTGWLEKEQEVKKAVEKNGTGLVYASNFSLGVNAFYRIVAQAAAVMNKFPAYDVFCLEMHHRNKADSPSGTAKSIEKILLEKIERKKKAIEEKLDRKIAADEMHVASLRGGSVPGTHAVFFDSSADTIELRHTARSREGFALGALQAAKWINGKKGFYSIEDMLGEMIADE